MSISGLLLRFAYRLRRHFWLGWSLSRWLGLLLIVLALVGLRWAWPELWLAAGFGLAWLVYVLLLGWAVRQKYLRFRPLADGAAWLRQTPESPPLGKLEMIPAGASGLFNVEGQSQYYVDLDADFETTGTREHIVLARAHPSRFMLATWPSHELGWWYLFVPPATIHSVCLGHLHHGARPRLGLRLVYAHKKEKEERLESVYLTFADAVALRRVWEDLVLDAPASAIAGRRR